MKRREFLRTLGLSCVGACCNPLNVLAAGRTTLNNRTGYKTGFPPLRLNPLRTSTPRITSLDDMTWDPGPLLDKYDERAQWRRDMYLEIFPENEIDYILDEMRESFEALIPDIPFIGESNFHLRWFIPNSEKLAEYLVVKNYGVSKKEYCNLHLTQASKDLLNNNTEAELIAIGKMQFGYPTELFMMATALWSQFRLYPDDYVIYFRKGDGVDFDWGLDYTQCANVQLYKKYDAQDLLLPMVCTQDYIAGAAMRTGYHRTMQIATGDPICDLRWKLQE